MEVVKKTELFSKFPLKLDGHFVQRYFGKEKQRVINYVEFSQLLHDFHEEYASEAFQSKDPSGSGYISPLDFQDIMIKVKKHLLTPEVQDNLVAVTIPTFIIINLVKLNARHLFSRSQKDTKSATHILWPLTRF